MGVISGHEVSTSVYILGSISALKFATGDILLQQIGRGTSPIASYVSMTRVKTREDLLI